MDEGGWVAGWKSRAVKACKRRGKNEISPGLKLPVHKIKARDVTQKRKEEGKCAWLSVLAVDGAAAVGSYKSRSSENVQTHECMHAYNKEKDRKKKLQRWKELEAVA